MDPNPETIPRKTILIIDDEVDVCLLMKSYYLRKNYLVHIAHTIEEALIQIEKEAPDFIHLDAALCKNVAKVVAEIRRRAPNAEIKNK